MSLALVEEKGRCPKVFNGSRCLRFAGHQSACRLVDDTASALWQAVADLMGMLPVRYVSGDGSVKEIPATAPNLVPFGLGPERGPKCITCGGTGLVECLAFVPEAPGWAPESRPCPACSPVEGDGAPSDLAGARAAIVELRAAHAAALARATAAEKRAQDWARNAGENGAAELLARRRAEAAEREKAAVEDALTEAEMKSALVERERDEARAERDEARAIAAEGRAAGRAEAAAILMDQDAETFPVGEYDGKTQTHPRSLVDDHDVGDTGDVSTEWNPVAVRKLFDVADGSPMASLLERLEGAYWERCGHEDDARERAERAERDLAAARALLAPSQETTPAARRGLPDDLDALSREAARLANGLAAEVEVEGSAWSFALFLYREARADERAGHVVQVSRDRERTKLAVARWLMDLLDSQRAKARG